MTQDTSPFRPLAKGALLLALLLACLVIVYFTPLRQLLHQMHQINTQLQGMGFWAPLVFVSGVAVLVAIGCPRLLLCPVAGMAFGFWEGFLWVQLGTLIGFYATFLFVRWGGQEFVMGRYPRLAQASRVFEHSGVSAVVLLRLMPVAGFFINIVLGITRIKHRDFALGTVLGTFPEAIPATLIGSGMTQYSFLISVSYIFFAVLCLISLWAVLGWYLKSSKSRTLQTIKKYLNDKLENQDACSGNK